MSLGPKAEKQKARTSLRAISNTRLATTASGFIWGGRRGVGILLPRNQRDHEDGLARAGWTAKRAARVYTRRKKVNDLPAPFSRGLPLPQETAHARIPRRSFRVGGCADRSRRGAGRGASMSAPGELGGARGQEVFNSPAMPHKLQSVFLF